MIQRAHDSTYFISPFSVQILIFKPLGIQKRSIFDTDIFEEGSGDSQSDYDMANAAADKQWEEANCVMHCSDENLPAGEKGQCIMKDMRCNGKKDCTGGEDEAKCPCKLTLNNCTNK